MVGECIHCLLENNSGSYTCLSCVTLLSCVFVMENSSETTHIIAQLFRQPLIPKTYGMEHYNYFIIVGYMS